MSWCIRPWNDFITLISSPTIDLLIFSFKSIFFFSIRETWITHKAVIFKARQNRRVGRGKKDGLISHESVDIKSPQGKSVNILTVPQIHKRMIRSSKPWGDVASSSQKIESRFHVLYYFFRSDRFTWFFSNIPPSDFSCDFNRFWKIISWVFTKWSIHAWTSTD